MSLPDRSLPATNISSTATRVVCAWPLSGQYGPGTRFLYYALICACFFGREVEWLRAACLAAALLFPAVAALHGIVLAAVHVDGAVDMDIYGALQVCAIGILLAPVTVMLSRSYFEQPGSSIIILWTALILAGQISLTIEFFRATTTVCTYDNTGNPLPTPSGATCSLVCSVEKGPYSLIRGGSANNIYVIPAPDKLTFHSGTLLSAACCIPAILLLICNWNKIREINRLKAKQSNARGGHDVEAQARPEVDDTNRPEAQTGSEAEYSNDQQHCDGHDDEAPTRPCNCNGLKYENTDNRRTRNIVATTIFGAAILSILIIGEWNFFSAQIRYQTEPITSIGQWAPVVGTWLALLGSVYVRLAKDVIFEQLKQDKKKQGKKKADTEKQEEMSSNTEHEHAHVATNPVLPGLASVNNAVCHRCGGVSRDSVQSSKGPSRKEKALRILADWRRQGVRKMIAVVDYIGTAPKDTFENTAAFLRAKLIWIHYPGESLKNPLLPETQDQYGRSTREFSRTIDQTTSRAGSIRSSYDPETTSIGFIQSPKSPSLPRFSSNETRLKTVTTVSDGSSQGGQRSSESPIRRGTSNALQVPTLPSPVHRATPMGSSPPSPTSSVILAGGVNVPSLVVTPDGDTSLLSPLMRGSLRDSHPSPPVTESHKWYFRRRNGTL